MDSMQPSVIRIKTMDNKITNIQCEIYLKVVDLKKHIQTQLGIPFERQRLIYQGKLMDNSELLSKYKIQQDYCVHLIAHLPSENQQSDQAQNLGELVMTTQDISRDLEILTGILRTLRQSSFNRQNLRRVIMQQRGNSMKNINPYLFLIRFQFRQNSVIRKCSPRGIEIKKQKIIFQIRLNSIDIFINPFRFSNKKIKIGQWIDLKDTIDQWVMNEQFKCIIKLEAQILDVKDNKVFVHYNGWGRRWDEWIDMDSSRIALFRTYTVGSPNQAFMSPTPVNQPDSDISMQNLDINEFIFDVGFQMNKVTAMLIEFGKYENFKRLKEKQIELLRQQKRLQELYNNQEESKTPIVDEELKEEEIKVLANKSSLMSSQLGPIFDRLGRMMMDLAPHFAMMGQQTQTIENQQSRTQVFQVPIILTPSELNQSQYTMNPIQPHIRESNQEEDNGFRIIDVDEQNQAVEELIYNSRDDTQIDQISDELLFYNVQIDLSHDLSDDQQDQQQI